MKKKFLFSTIIFLLLVFIILFFTGCLGHKDFRMDIWVLKTDTKGTIEWMTIINDDPNNRGESIIQTSDMKFAIAGTGSDLRRKSPVPSIFRLFSNGTIQSPILMNTSPDYGSSITETPENGYVIVSYSGIVSRVSEKGEVLWSTPLNKGNEWWKVVKTSRGGYAIGGGNRVIKLNENGTLAWDTQFNGDRNVSIIITEPAGGVIIGGATNAEVWISQISPDGVIIMNTSFESSSPAHLYSVWISPVGTYEAVYGSSVYREEEKNKKWISNTTLISLSANGKPIKKHPVNASRFITATDNGGYAFTGYAVPESDEFMQQGSPGAPLHLVRMDPDGKVLMDISYDIGNSGPVSSVIQTDDGGFVIMGRMYSS